MDEDVVELMYTLFRFRKSYSLTIMFISWSQFRAI
jgi:hypothetical protein